MIKNDALKVSIGSTLMQDIVFGIKYVQYMRKIIYSAESRYFIHDYEILIIVSPFKIFRPYISNGHTLVLSDHEPLKYITS